MTSSSFCTHCGKRFADDDRVCTECGTGRSPDAATPARPPFDGSSSSLAPTVRRYESPGTYQEQPLPPEDPQSAPLAGWGNRVPAFLITTTTTLVPSFFGAIPVLGLLVSLGLLIWTWVLYRRGLDIGARLTGLRVVRENGELAGFFHMYTRQLAASISFIVLGAGYWTAFSDPRRQTWHDKMMRTYVVQDHPGLNDLPATSSTAAVIWFWLSLIFIPALYFGVIAPALSSYNGGS